MPPLGMASRKEVIAHDNPKRQHKRPQFGRQLLGTAGLVDGCASDRNCLCMAIRLVTRVRGRFAWRPSGCSVLNFPRRVPKESPAGGEASLRAEWGISPRVLICRLEC